MEIDSIDMDSRELDMGMMMDLMMGMKLLLHPSISSIFLILPRLIRSHIPVIDWILVEIKLTLISMFHFDDFGYPTRLDPL
jgi:hypothetical protein